MTQYLLAHEWLERIGGSENTFEQMMRTIPTARIVCLWNNAPERFKRAEETFLARTPARRSKASSLALMRTAWGRVDLSGVDVVIASSHAMAHHLAGRASSLGRRGVAYVYSPARYLWAPDLDARGQRVVARTVRPLYRALDRRGLHQDVSYVGISKYVAERMRSSWGVEPSVHYPPVDTGRIRAVDDWASHVTEAEHELLEGLPGAFVLGASRLVEYKRLDVAMKVGEAIGLPVVIAGDGPYARELNSFADSVNTPVHFVGRVSDAMLFALYQRTSLYVFMPVEDFGIMPIEAMALGARVLVRDSGGTAEVVDLLGMGHTVDPDNTGMLREMSRAALDSQAPDGEIVSRVFSNEVFREGFARIVADLGAG